MKAVIREKYYCNFHINNFNCELKKNEGIKTINSLKYVGDSCKIRLFKYEIV